MWDDGWTLVTKDLKLSAQFEHTILITDTGNGAIGLKVDEVRRIVNVASDALLPPPEIVRGIRGDLLIAIVPQGEEVYLLIDIDSVLTGEEKTALQSAELSSTGVSER